VSNVRKIIHLDPPAELDLSTIDEFAEKVDEALAQAPDVLVVELGGVEFVGVVGVEYLRDVQDVLAQQGARLRVQHADWHIRRLLELTGRDFESS